MLRLQALLRRRTCEPDLWPNNTPLDVYMAIDCDCVELIRSTCLIEEQELESAPLYVVTNRINEHAIESVDI